MRSKVACWTIMVAFVAAACGGGNGGTITASTSTTDSATSADDAGNDETASTTAASPTTTAAPILEPAEDVCTEDWKRDLFPEGHGGSANPPEGVTFIAMPGFDRIQFATSGFQIHMVGELGSDPQGLYGVDVEGSSHYLVTMAGWGGTDTGPERIPAPDAGNVTEVVAIEAANPGELAFVVGLDHTAMVRTARGEASGTLWLDVCH